MPSIPSEHTVLVGLSHTKEYYGEGNIHKRTQIETTVELFFSTTTGNVLNAPSLTQYASYISGLQNIGGFGNFSIGTISFINSRVISASFPSSVGFGENKVTSGKAVITVESFQEGDISSISGAYTDGLTTGINNANLVSLSESFSANESASGEYSFNHDVSIELSDTTTDSQAAAKAIALAIFNSNPPFGIHFRSGVLSSSLRGKDLFSEKIDEIHNRYTFSRKYAEKPGICGTGWCALVDYTFAFGESGEITVTEKADITGIAWANVLAGYNYLLPGAHGRCNVVYQRGNNGWTNKIAGQAPTQGLPGSLHVQSVDLSQSANTAAFHITYETTFTNDIQMSTLYTISRNIQYTADADNIITATENATLTAYVKKFSGVNLLQAMFIEWSGAFARISASRPNEIHQNPYVMIDENFDFSQHGKNANYTRTFNTDPSYQSCPAGFNKAKITFDDQMPREIMNEYPIIRSAHGVIVHTPGQMTPGSRSVSFDGQLARILPLAGHPFDFTRLKMWWNIMRPRAAVGVGIRLKAALLNVLIDNALPFPVPYAPWDANGTDLYLTDVSYTIDSSGHVTGSATATFHPQFINSGP